MTPPTPSKPTPGPWKLHSDQTTVRHIPLESWTVVRDDRSVADVFYNKADARLIACAPELLEALKEVTENLMIPLSEYNARRKRNRALIARAEGRKE
jgi:hypothetical protein